MENIEVFSPGNYKVHARYRGFTVESDQPQAAGGDDSAPTPTDLFMISLATCIGYFVVAFCRKRDIPTEGIKVVQSMVRNEKSHLVTKVSIDVQLPPGFPAQYREAILRAANHCTVKRHLAQPPEIELVSSVSGA